MSFEAAEQIANAVLYEGYLLYPHRASALKNPVRWQFGVVAPRGYAEATQADPWYVQTECLIEPETDPAIDIRVRCLQVYGDAGLERTVNIRDLKVDRLLAGEHVEPIVLRRGEDTPIEGQLRARGEQIDHLIKLRLRLENVTPLTDGDLSRDAVMCAAFVGTHTLVVIRGGRFVSLIDPPAEAAVAAASCVNLHMWPVLVGDPARSDTLLSSPVTLYDFPWIAPESRGALFDATEIEQIVNGAESMTAVDFDALHGAWRELLNRAEPPPEQATVEAGGVTIGRGSRVIVRPRRRADSIDLLIAGRTALVEGVYHDLDGHVLVAVVVDDDASGEPCAEIGRFLYYGPEELEPVK